MDYDDFVEKIERDVEFRGATAEACRCSFKRYFKTVFFLVNGSKVFFKPFHHGIIKKLQAIVDGTAERRNLGICVPVGSGKSLIIEYFITWCFARSIDAAFCYVSHSESLITRMSKETRDIADNPLWKMLFGAELKYGDRAKVNYSFVGAKKRTGMTARAMGAGATGLDAGNPNVPGFSGALLIDDPIDAGKIRHENARQICNEDYARKFSTRRRTPTTPTIVIMQRLGIDDLIGWVKENEPELWDFVEVEALGADGESFWPERYPVEELLKIKAVDQFLFSSQYQQNPTADGGSIIKKEWWKFYDYAEELRQKTFLRWAFFLTADTAFKKGDANDRSALQAWCMTRDRLLLLGGECGKWEFPELKERAKAFYQKWAIMQPQMNVRFYIEDKASGTPLIQVFNDAGLPCDAWSPKAFDWPDNKVERMTASALAMYAGTVYVRPEDPYSEVLMDECAAFTVNDSHRYDDNCDAFTMALSIWTWNGGQIPKTTGIEGDKI